MTFELGKEYIVDVTEKGIMPREVFDRDRWYDIEHDNLAFLTYEEKVVVINDVLDKIRAEIKGMTPTYHNPDWSITDLAPISEVLKLIDKYKAESEDNA